MDDSGRQTLTFNTPPPDGVDIPVAVDEPGKPDSNTGNTPESVATLGDVSEPESLPLLPTPFTALVGAEMEFRGKAAYMQRTGRYQILFHETWVQPVASEQRALPIVVDRSGDTREWPRLQGSVKLYLSRFLHIETDLWLNTNGNYLPASWEMTPAPLGPTSLIFEYPELPVEPSDTVAPPLTGANNPMDREPAIPEPAEMALEEPIEDEPMIEETGPLYPWRHAVQLQQKRKMRSTEVHYIDHPMLGVVVLVSPITDEELEVMAATEFAAETETSQSSM